MSRSLFTVGRNIDRTDKRAMKLSRGIQNTAANFVSGAGRMVKSSAKMAAGIAKNIATAGVALTGLGGIGLGSAIKTAFSEAIDLEGYKTQLETATKDTKKASKIMQYAINLANKTPFEGGQLVEGAAKFEAMGMSAKKWLTYAGDMAAATNKDFDQSVEALIDAQAGELERLKEFGITKTMIQNKAEEMFKNQQVINNKGQIVNQEKFNEAMLKLMSEKYSGGMEKQSKTLKGAWSTVTGVAKSSLSQLVGMSSNGSIKAGSMMDVLKGKISSLAERFQQWQNDGTIDGISKKIQSGFTTAYGYVSNFVTGAINLFNTLKANGTIDAVVNGATTAFQGLLTIATNVFGFISEHSTAFSVLAGFVGGAAVAVKGITVAMKAYEFATAAANVVMGLLNGTIAISPLGWLVIAIGAAVAAGVLLIKNWNKVKVVALAMGEKVKGVFNGIKSTIQGVIDKVMGLINTIKNSKVGKFVGGVVDKVKGHATGTHYFGGGLTTVNEHGGEIINLPSGTQIIPHDISKNKVGGKSINVNVSVQGNVIGNKEYAKEMGETIAEEILFAIDNN